MDSAPHLGRLPRPGETIDRYAVVAEIAHGGMAAVFAIRRASLGGFEKLLAMKVLLPHLAGDRRFVDMFLDEARIAALIRHANVVQIFDVGEHGGTPFIVMEYLQGQTFSRVQKRARESGVPLARAFVLATLAEAAAGLHAAHETTGPDGESLQIVHRDVSPQNVHVGADGQVKVLDFGIAAARGRLTATRSGEVKGKLAYLSPEQVSRAPFDRRADVWALGVMAWEALSGRRLFVAQDEATTIWNVVNLKIPPLGPLAPDLPREVGECVMQCLVRDPAQRTADCLRVAQTLAAVAERLGQGQARDRARRMTELFRVDFAVEEERLTAALRETPAPLRSPEPTSGEDSGGHSASTGPTTAPDRPSARRGRLPRWAPYAAAGVVVLGLGVALLGRGIAAKGDRPARADAGPGVAAVPTLPPAAAPLAAASSAPAAAPATTLASRAPQPPDAAAAAAPARPGKLRRPAAGARPRPGKTRLPGDLLKSPY
jgi:serine/threonine-protein kinase